MLDSQTIAIASETLAGEAQGARVLLPGEIPGVEVIHHRLQAGDSVRRPCMTLGGFNDISFRPQRWSVKSSRSKHACRPYDANSIRTASRAGDTLIARSDPSRPPVASVKLAIGCGFPNR